MAKTSGLRLAIDIGGTFTDTVLVSGEDNILATTKTPTTTANPALAALEGARRVMDSAKIDWSQIEGFIHGTTLATNDLIERRGAVVATVTTRGFRDILEIGYERRYSQYDINLVKPDLLVPRSRAFTIGGRVNAHGDEIERFDDTSLSQLVSDLQSCGAEAVAICLMHSYANPSHELRLQELLQTALPEIVISVSHEVSPEAREFDRLTTTIANAYIQPRMAKYLADFESAFSENGLRCPIFMMTASGGMTTLETAARLPIRLVESGPAGGAILAARIASEIDAQEVLSFDMGGTTAKLCLIDQFQPQKSRKFEIARAARFIKGSGMPVRIPVIEMIEIGAGGGSIAEVDRLGRLTVGPKSAGSDPGPAAFGNGGRAPTVTDADIVQGLIDPKRFAEGRLAIDVDAARQSLQDALGQHMALPDDQCARGVSEIVDENMASAGRMHAVESGKDLSQRVMIAFGGNGPLHATRIARRAQVNRILIPRNPGVGSALGFVFAPISFEIVRSRHTTLEAFDPTGLNDFFDEMLMHARDVVRTASPHGRLAQNRTAFMRYQGQGHEIAVSLPDRALRDSDVDLLRAAFEAEYVKQFNRIVPGMNLEVMNWAVEVCVARPKASKHIDVQAKRQPTPTRSRSILCDVSNTWRKVDVFDREQLQPGDRLDGPALIVEPQTTTLVSADFQACVDGGGNIWLQKLMEADT